MNTEVKINVYETQAILYWILGVLVLHLGSWDWLGWLSIGYGWFTFIYTVNYAFKHHSDIERARAN
jgi:hypothetical protein